MDLDEDGTRDVISGSYWPGHLFWFRGGPDGVFSRGIELIDIDGEKLHAGRPWKSDREPDMDSLAAAPFLVDWDGDGDLDALVGNIAGHVILIRNEGDAKAPRFGKTREPLLADGRPIAVGHGDAGPTMADWDGDGRLDLLVGGGDGSVTLFRNEVEKGFRFGRGIPLVTAMAAEEGPVAVPTRSGARAKPHVVDWDGDGKLDLLVGDLATLPADGPKLTPEQEKRRDALVARQSELMDELSKIEAEVGPDSDAPESAKAKVMKIVEVLSKVDEELQPLLAQPRMAGFVWLYRRR